MMHSLIEQVQTEVLRFKILSDLDRCYPQPKHSDLTWLDLKSTGTDAWLNADDMLRQLVDGRLAHRSGRIYTTVDRGQLKDN
jgi:hypothetical protein